MPQKPLINPYIFEDDQRVLRHYEKLASFIKGGKILDLGCGTGRLKKVIDNSIEIHGVDFEQKRVELCKNLGYASVHGLNIDENTLPYSDNYFTTVACFDILEHLYNPLKLLKEANRVLENGGRIVIASPNIGFWLFRIFHLFGIFSDLEIPQGIVGSHIRFFTIRRLKNILRLCGFKTKIVEGLTLIPSWPRIIAEPINFLAQIYPSLFAYTLILVAEKKESPLKGLEDLTLTKNKSILKQFLTMIKWG